MVTKDGAEAAAGWAMDAVRELKKFIRAVADDGGNTESLDEAIRLIEFAQDEANHQN